MVNVSFQELAESIQEKRANGMSLDEIWALATEAGISEEEWEQSLLLIRKYRIHEKETKLVSSTINVVWGVVFLIAVFVILFFVFTYRDVFFGKSSEEIQQEELENTEKPDELLYKNDPNYLAMTEEKKKSFEEGTYDKGEPDKPKEITKKTLNDFELTIRDVEAMPKAEWEAILNSIVEIETTNINNHEIYIFRFGRDRTPTGFWIHKTTAILAQPFTRKLSDFTIKEEMQHILQNYPSDLVKDDLFFVDEFNIFMEISEKKLSNILDKRK